MRSTARSQIDDSLEGVPLSSLAACMTDREEDALKLDVLEAISRPAECVSPAGRYRFVETKNLNAFLMWIERSFGFLTAVEIARTAIAAAHAEARGAWNGVGLVKLMGRHSGFIAAEATLANSDVNFCLVPEVPVDLEGEHGFLAAIERRLVERQHAVVVVAEGASDVLMTPDGPVQHDKSGNRKLEDVGVFLRDRMKDHFRERGIEMNIKYIDPSYMIRGIQANASDSSFCLALGQHAVHAGLSGCTNMLIGYWNQKFVHLPMKLATSGRRRIEPKGAFWNLVELSTGQPKMFAKPDEG